MQLAVLIIEEQLALGVLVCVIVADVVAIGRPFVASAAVFQHDLTAGDAGLFGFDLVYYLVNLSRWTLRRARSRLTDRNQAVCG